jgi:hypothetical protein
MRFCFLWVLSSMVGRARAQIDLVNRTSQRTDSSFIFIGVKEIRIGGTTLTAEAIAVIQQLRPGDKIVFDEILVTGRNCRIRELPPFTITIAAP